MERIEDILNVIERIQESENGFKNLGDLIIACGFCGVILGIYLRTR